MPCVVALLLLVGGLRRTANADYEATEARLKTAGIDADLRKQIHDSIDRGVAWLLERQRRPDGGFLFRPGDASPHETQNELGCTALCALALRHAGTIEAMKGFRKAERFLLHKGAERLEAIAGRTYVAGITAMLVMANGGPPAAAARLGAALVRGQSESGSWGYDTNSADAGPPLNLSTAQFGTLGLWAAERSGAEIAIEAWTRVATLQVETHTSGRWGYAATGGGASPRYPQGTFMGLANLLLAEAALERQPEPPVALLERVAKVRARALDALAKDVPKFLAKFGKYATGRSAFSDSWQISPFYSLYALEKVCIFADVEKIGGVSWYRQGARHLLGCQAEDGGWMTRDSRAYGTGESRYTATAFALLFLLRASESYHPVTPRPVDGRPRGDVTPSKTDADGTAKDAPAPTPDPKPDPKRPPVPPRDDR